MDANADPIFSMASGSDLQLRHVTSEIGLFHTARASCFLTDREMSPVWFSNQMKKKKKKKKKNIRKYTVKGTAFEKITSFKFS